MNNSQTKLIDIVGRGILIYSDTKGNFLPNNTMTFKSFGKEYGKLSENPLQTTNIILQKGTVIVLNQVGEEDFHFPELWLDPYQMQIHNLAKKGYLKLQ